ncbi:MAG: hypothetical protein ACQCN4_12910 [Candidatus Bathyarchaeia archaeon]|jgi:hypothetical protein
MAIAVLYWYPILVFVVIFLAMTAFSLIKFSSLRNIHKKRNWLFYAAVTLIVVVPAYEAYNDFIGPAIVSYRTADGQNYFYPDRVNQLTVTSSNLGMRATSFNLIVKAVNASMMVEGQDYVQINSTAVKIPFSLVQKETRTRTIKFMIDKNVASFDFHFDIDHQAGSPISTTSYTQLHCEWKSNNNRYEAKPVYGPMV